MTRPDALLSAINAAGSQSGLARICGVSQNAVWKWIHISGILPAEHVLKVEAATGVSRHDLRPDLYPREEAITEVVGRNAVAAHGNRCGSLDKGGLA